jgi:hypothetical protein
MRLLGWALIQHDWCPYKKRTPCEDRLTGADSNEMMEAKLE